MLLRNILYLVTVSFLFSIQANAQTAFNYETVNVSDDNHIEVKVVSSLVENEAMTDQVLNKGCIPRGELLANASASINFDFKGINEKNSLIKGKFTICDDSMDLLTKPRASFRLIVWFTQAEGQRFNRKILPNIKMITPSGQVLQTTEYCSNSGVKTCTYVIRDAVTGNWLNNLTESGTYEFTIENLSDQEVKQIIQFHVGTSKVLQ